MVRLWGLLPASEDERPSENGEVVAPEEPQSPKGSDRAEGPDVDKAGGDPAGQPEE
jgi:hypothetical protein